MSNDYKEVKSRVNIVSEIERISGLKSKKQGNSHDFESCPFCNHKECFKDSENDQLFNCFSCSTTGDIFTFYEKYYSISKHESLINVASSCNYQLTNHTKQPESSILNDIVEYYHNSLMNTQTALKYQTQIRKHSIDSLKTMKIGLTTGNLHKNLTSKGYSDQEQLETGLVTNKNGQIRDFFVKDVFFYPHRCLSGEYGHFTIKDQQKKFQYQLPNEYRHDECLFYNMQAFNNNNEIIIVEGENDLLSFIDAGISNVIGIDGQLSEKQAKYIQEWASKRHEQKTIYTCFDNDDAGIKYTQKLINLLEFDCYVDILTFEIGKSLQLRIFDIDKQFKDIDDYLKTKAKNDTSKKQTLIKRLMKRSKRHMLILKDQIRRYKAALEERNNSSDPKLKPSPVIIGKICAEYFNATGTYFVDKSNGYACNLFYNDQIYEISDNVPYCALMNKIADLNASQNGFRMIRQEIIDYAFYTGKNVDTPGWITSKINDGVIYFNLCNERNELVKISSGEIEIVKNGSNSEKILLINSPKMQGIDYDDSVSIKESMSLLKRLIFDNLACSDDDKFYFLCFLINTFFVNFVKAKGLLKLSGNAGSGKTTAAELGSCLIFGDPLITTGTTASDYTEATQSPLIILDNLERDGINTAKKDFLLFVATGVTRRKRDKNTQTGNVYERVNTQTIWTAIEPPEKDELIQRTIVIDFRKAFWSTGFSTTEVTEEIKLYRNKILSGIIKMIANDILPEFREKRKKALTFIQKTHPDHSKERLNELFASLFIIAKEVSKYIKYPEIQESKHQHLLILEKWIQKQDRLAKNTAKNTSEIVRFFESLATEYIYHKAQLQEEFPQIQTIETMNSYTGEYERIDFLLKTQDLLAFFDYDAKRKGNKNPFRTAQALNARIRNSINILHESNWEYISKVKTVNGYFVHQVTKYFLAEEE